MILSLMGVLLDFQTWSRIAADDILTALSADKNVLLCIALIFAITAVIVLGRLIQPRMIKFLKAKDLNHTSTWIAKYSNLIFLCAWFAGFAFFLKVFSEVDARDRLFLSSAMIFSFWLLNRSKQLVYDFAVTSFLTVFSLYKFVQRLFSKTESSNQKELSKSGIDQWVRFRLRTLVAPGLIMLSFCFELVMPSGSVFLGISILLIGTAYLVATAKDGWRLLQGFAVVTWLAEKGEKNLTSGGGIEAWIKSMPHGARVFEGFGLINSIFPKESASLLIALKNKLENWHFNSRLLLIGARFLLFGLVISPFLFITVLLVTLEGNFLYAHAPAIDQSAVRANFFADAFYLYSGEPIELNEKAGTFLHLQTMGFSFLGWIMLGLMLALSLEIVTSSFEPVEKLTSRVIDLAREKLEKFISTVEKTSMPEDLRTFAPLGLFVVQKVKPILPWAFLKWIADRLESKLSEMAAAQKKTENAAKIEGKTEEIRKEPKS